MSDQFERYAVYWVPGHDDGLSTFGAHWTGWCADRGEPWARGGLRGLSFDILEVTRSTCRHGIHAALRAPFHLANGRSTFALDTVIRQLAETVVAFALPRLRLAVIDRRVVLVPRQACPDIGALLNRIDEALAAFDADAQARGFAKAAGQETSAIGGGQVVRFPTAERHRFHVPLTDPLDPDLAHKVLSELRPLLEPMLDVPHRMASLALMGDPSEGRPFRVLEHYELRAAPIRPATHALPCAGPHVLTPPLCDDPEAEPKFAV